MREYPKLGGGKLATYVDMQRVILKSMAHRLNQILREHAKGASYRGQRGYTH